MRDGGAGDGHFGGFALEVYRFQIEHSAPYRNYCREVLGESRAASLDDPDAVPAVPTDAFKPPGTLPVCFPEEQAEAVFLTSGTTSGGRGRHPLFSTALYRASARLAWERLGLPRGPVVALAPSPAHAPDSSLSFMLGALGARFAVGADGTLDPAPLERARASAAAAPLQPPVVFGTALAFLHLFGSLGYRTRLPPGSAVVETGGYKASGRAVAKPDLYRLIADRLGVDPDNVLNEYSMTELSSQFYARGPAGLHAAPHWVRARVIDPSTGRPAREGATGFLQIHDLANLGSAATVSTRDLAVVRGDRFELLGRDPQALPRGCSLGAQELLAGAPGSAAREP